MADIIKVTSQVLGRDVKYVVGPGRPFDVKTIVLDVSLMRSLTGWTPKISLSDGIRRLVDHYAGGSRS